MRMSLKQARKHTGETLVDVATAVGVDPGHLSRIERGMAPKRAVARALYRHYGGLVHYIDIIDQDFFHEVGLVEITTSELQMPSNTHYRLTTHDGSFHATGANQFRSLLRVHRLFEVWKDFI